MLVPSVDLLMFGSLVLVAPGGVFSCATLTLSCGMWDLVL